MRRNRNEYQTANQLGTRTARFDYLKHLMSRLSDENSLLICVSCITRIRKRRKMSFISHLIILSNYDSFNNVFSFLIYRHTVARRHTFAFWSFDSYTQAHCFFPQSKIGLRAQKKKRQRTNASYFFFFIFHRLYATCNKPSLFLAIIWK